MQNEELSNKEKGNDTAPIVSISPFNTRNKINIEDVSDFNDVCSDIFDDFLSTFTVENGLIREATEDDKINCDFDIDFVYTKRGGLLAERMLDRLYKVGEHYFDEFIEITSTRWMVS